jgi:hypothetical protein
MFAFIRPYRAGIAMIWLFAGNISPLIAISKNSVAVIVMCYAKHCPCMPCMISIGKNPHLTWTAF